MDKVEIEKNSTGGVKSVKVTHTEPNHIDGVGDVTDFYYRIDKKCNHITNLSVDDHDVYAKISVTHLDSFTKPYEKIAQGQKAKLAMELIGAKDKSIDDLTPQEQDDVVFVYNSIFILTKEEYESEANI